MPKVLQWIALFLVLSSMSRSLAEDLPALDLSSFCRNESDCKSVDLQGSWGFHKGEILSVESILRDRKTSILAVPGTWSPSPLNPFNPLWNEAQDVGTYWLVLRGLRARPGLGMHLANVHGGFRVSWQPLAESRMREPLFQFGWNEQNPHLSQVNLKDDFIPLPVATEPGDYLLVIQVANQNLAKAGLRTAPRIGLMQDLQKDQLERMLLYALVIGATFIIAVYHFLIFLQRKSDRSALWLALECLLIISHTVAMQRMYQYAYGEASNAFTLMVTWMIYTPHIAAPIVFYAFLVFHFPRMWHRSAPYVFGIPSLVLALCYLTPLSFYGRLYAIGFMPVMTVFILYIFYRSFFAFRGNRDFQAIFAGITLLGLASIHDAMGGTGPKASRGLVPFAEVIFIMLQGWLLSKRFAKAYNTASRLSRHLEKEVQQQTRDIRSILDTIQQGIVTIQDGEMKLGKEHSKLMQEWFDQALTGQSFELVLDQSPSLSSDLRDQIKEVLKASVGEDLLNFEVNAALLPAELIMMVQGQKRFFELDWTPIVDGANRIEKILVCLRDVTEVRSLRDQSRQNEEELKIIQELLNIPEDRFKSFVKKMNQYLSESQVLVGTLERNEAANRMESIRQIFMNIHTIKGTARTLHLQAIAAASHDLEKEISRLRQSEGQREMNPLRDKFEHVQSVINRYQTVSHEKLGWDLAEDNVRLPKRLVLECAHVLAEVPEAGLKPDLVRNVHRLEADLLQFCPSDLQHSIHEASRGVDSIARDLGKIPPRIQVDADQIMLTDAGSHLIEALFTHLIRNSLDHGLEEVSERIAHGKPEQGEIRITAEVRDKRLHVRCQDDGRGLNLRKIRTKGEMLGMIAAGQTVSPQQIADLIFKSGLSTKEEVTEISGRGVGMDAVRSFVERAGGKVDVILNQPLASEQKAAFALILQLPADYWWVSESGRRLGRTA